MKKDTKEYFITSVGTDIGKTYVLCDLIEKLIVKKKNVTALKPIISGFDLESDNIKESDTFKILNSLELPSTAGNIEKISPWRFNLPLSPDMASKKEGRKIPFNEVVDFCNNEKGKSEYLFVEGVGGVMVPINEKYLICDLIKELNIPSILITGSYLGSISHTLSAIEALKQKDATLELIIINDYNCNVATEDTIKTLKNFTNTPIATLEDSLQYIL